ncbi:phosphate ABC transporter substrate-binding protein PstS [Candidatus Bathyarchaeota archaeon]|nr:phosphate ABC transporter substrate-binding protein PstS [Candidatus Bathyarchaeota archaeon]
MGAYGYIATTTAQPQYTFTDCAPFPPGSRDLPDCLPSITLSETGSALMYPMFQLWAQQFTDKYPNIQINTANTGSGQGQAFVAKGLVQIGGSAAYFTNQQIGQNPNLQNFLNIPLAVTDTLVEYDVPGIPQSMHLNFTATLLAEIYNTTIQYWNDKAIIALNPGAASILSAENPPVGIWPFYRSDAAADTWLFTQYLSTDSWWNWTIGYGLSVHWPTCYSTQDHQCLSNIPQSALGNPGIVIQAAPVKGSISYVSIEAFDRWVNRTDYPQGIGNLQNQAGKFIDPLSKDGVSSALDALSNQTPADERLSLVNAPGDKSYPIVGYGYAIVNKAQLNPDFATVLRAFLTYCALPNFGSTADNLASYRFTALPDSVLQLSLNQIAQIGP